MQEIEINNFDIILQSFHYIIVGSGAAGLNCALHLVEEGISGEKIAIITEELGAGTSFNTGSDKQTYYKMSVIGDQDDSPYRMASDFFDGGAMHGDIALIECTNSLREFYHLVQLGVPFPHDKYGGLVGYKTDYDPRQRATSIGPLTSQKMCECLLKAIRKTKITILDHFYVMDLLVETNQNKNRIFGLIAINRENLSEAPNLSNIFQNMRIYLANNIIIATGGPAALYKNSVYPQSQWGSLGLAINAGCTLQNLTESQFGLASTQFRWNLSGSYQQVIPRYFSKNDNDKENEFLEQYFPTFNMLSRAIFLKGYQWPFNSERIEDHGSSLIDLAVYYETIVLKNEVYLDFRNNSQSYDEGKLDKEAKNYLDNSNALDETPIKRLKKLNPDAIELYKNHDIDLWKDPLQIAVCNQHLNGGIKGDIWWETNIKNLFAIGEANGSHGIHRPGGSALNSGQVGGLRAAQKIAHRLNKFSSPALTSSQKHILKKKLHKRFNEFTSLFSTENDNSSTPTQILNQIRNRMANFGSIIRPMKNLSEELIQISQQINNFSSLVQLDNISDIITYLRVKDALITQKYILTSILNYHKFNGKSRGSFLILRDQLNKSYEETYITPPKSLKIFRFITSERNLKNKIQTIESIGREPKLKWEDVRPIPNDFGWFEKTWKKFKEGRIFD